MYSGPQPVYIARPSWAGAQPCYVRKVGRDWQTAPLAAQGLSDHVRFAACPVSDASDTRRSAVMAFDYYHNRLASA
jgi:hypothetical protein